MELYELWTVICDNYGYCTEWLVLWNLEYEDCLWELNHWYEESSPYCKFQEYEG